jgi:hypothetical protein
VPAPLRVDDGAVRVNLLVFAMRGLAMKGVPRPRFDYREALWRIAVRVDGELAWFAIACDIDDPVVRALGGRIVRYPTRAARIDARWRVATAAGTLELHLTETAEPVAAVAARRTFVRAGSRVYEIPWEEIAAPERRLARVDVVADALADATFGGGVAWDGSGVVHRGRVHMCGVARRVSS